jgi:hypothetical protein
VEQDADGEDYDSFVRRLDETRRRRRSEEADDDE